MIKLSAMMKREITMFHHGFFLNKKAFVNLKLHPGF